MYFYTLNINRTQVVKFIDPTGMEGEDSGGDGSPVKLGRHEVGTKSGGLLDAAIESIKDAFGFGTRMDDYSSAAKAKESQAHNEEQTAKLESTKEALHTINETMLSVVPGADIVYKGANDREITIGDIGWTVAGILPVGKIGKLAKGAEKGTSIWSRTKALSAVENAFSHWRKHGKEFSEFQNAKQYIEGAKDFLHNSPSGTLTKVRPNGDILKYNPKTNTFGVMDATGVPRTMFKPTDGLKYWKKQ